MFETFVLLGIEYAKQKYVPKWTEQANWNNLILMNRAMFIIMIQKEYLYVSKFIVHNVANLG